MANIYESANGWVNTLINEALSNQLFDKTLLCKIENNNSAAIGKYIVSYNSVIFEAFTDSQQKYEVNDSVYILIPQGNFDEQKIILCKKR